MYDDAKAITLIQSHPSLVCNIFIGYLVRYNLKTHCNKAVKKRILSTFTLPAEEDEVGAACVVRTVGVAGVAGVGVEENSGKVVVVGVPPWGLPGLIFDWGASWASD